MNHLKVALGGVGLITLSIILVAVRSTPPIAATATSSSDTFDPSWKAAAGSLALKSAALSADQVRIVPIERITPTPPVIPPILVTQEPKPKQVAEVDICKKHGRRKVVRNGSWRCRR